MLMLLEKNELYPPVRGSRLPAWLAAGLRGLLLAWMLLVIGLLLCPAWLLLNGLGYHFVPRLQKPGPGDRGSWGWDC